MSESTRVARPLGRRERRKQELQLRIREAALRLFREKGYEATTVEEIAELADVAKGTFFNYFPRKDSILEALAEDVIEELFEALGPPESWEGTAREQLLRLFLRIGALVGGDAELSKVMLIENMRRFWLRTEADAIEEEFDEVIGRVLARGAERGELDPASDLAAGAKLIKTAHFMTMVDWLKEGAEEGVYGRNLAVQFEIIFRGLGEAGRAVKG